MVAIVRDASIALLTPAIAIWRESRAARTNSCAIDAWLFAISASGSLSNCAGSSGWLQFCSRIEARTSFTGDEQASAHIHGHSPAACPHNTDKILVTSRSKSAIEQERASYLYFTPIGCFVRAFSPPDHRT